MRNRKRVCIVIPIYKTRPSANEKNSLLRILELYEGVYDIFLIGPLGLNDENYQLGHRKIPIFMFHSKYFKSVFTYNLLLLHPSFYIPFKKYQRMLIHQLDAFIFKDMLDEVCSWDYDYIGAPWLNNNWKSMMDKKLKTNFFSRFFLQVGNGGFSLRNPRKSFYIAILFYPFKFLWKKKWNEDLFWSTICHYFVPGYKVASLEKALLFSIEDSPKEAIRLIGHQLPFGCHAWEKNNPEFWLPHFEKLGYKMTTNNNT